MTNDRHPSTSRRGQGVTVLATIVAFLLVAVLMLGLLIDTAAEPSPEFAVEELRPADSALEPGERLATSALVRNVDDHSGTQRVELRVGGTVYDNATIELEPGDAARVRFVDVAVDSHEVGTYTYGVHAESDEATGRLAVEGDGPPEFVVRRLEPGDVVLDDDDGIDVTGIVTNVGESVGNRTVRFRVGDLLTANTSVELGPGESETVRLFDFEASGVYAGTYTYGIHTADDEATATLTVDRPRPARLVVEAVAVATPVIHRSDALSLVANVTNTGDEGNPADLTVIVDGEPVHREGVRIAPGETERVRIDDVAAPAVGRHTVKLSSGQTARSDTVVVEGDEPGRFAIEDVRPGNFTVEYGGRMNVTANVTNVGERLTTQRVVIRIANRVWTSTERTIPPGETKRVWAYNVNTDYLRPGTYYYHVFTSDETERRTVTVEGR